MQIFLVLVIAYLLIGCGFYCAVMGRMKSVDLSEYLERQLKQYQFPITRDNIEAARRAHAKMLLRDCVFHWPVYLVL